MVKLVIYLAFLFCFATLTRSQDTHVVSDAFSALPRITHFTQTDFKGDSQFWGMCRDSLGIYYFGNNDGTLVYDGERWEKVVLPNSSSVRSIHYSSNGKVYAGGYNEFGTIERDSLGEYRFISLIDKFRLNNSNLENIWQIHEVDANIILRTFKGLVAVGPTSSTYIPSAGIFTFAGIVDGRYFVQDEVSGIMIFDPRTKELSTLFSPQSIDNEKVAAFFSSTDAETVEFATESGNIYKGNILTGKVDKLLSVFDELQNESLSVAIKKNDDYLIGTIASKILLISSEGVSKQVPTAFKNINDATILGLYEGQDELWVLLNNGIDLITYTPRMNHLFDEASVYDILLKDDYIYLATNNGIYAANYGRVQNQIEFSRLPVPQGQAWSFTEFEDTILISHDKGIYQLTDFDVTRIGQIEGIWKIIPVSNAQNKYLACSYNGFYLLEKKKNRFTVIRKIKGFEESTRDVLPADQNATFWVCHGYKGVYRVKFDADYSRVYAIDHFTNQNGLLSPFNINVHRWDSKQIFSTNTGLYVYDSINERFVSYYPLNTVLDSTVNTRKLIAAGDTAWVVLDDEVGYFKTKEKNKVIHKDFFQNLKGKLNRGLESILPLENDKVLIGAKTGLFLYNLNMPIKEISNTVITSVAMLNNQEENKLPIVDIVERVQINTNADVLRFDFASPKYSPANKVQYRYKLEDLDRDWSIWSETNFKEYTHLRPGNYNFVVKSMDLEGNPGDEISYSFRILPKWYQTNIAYLLYTFLFLISLGTGYRIIKNKIQLEKRKSLIAAEKSKRLLELEIERLKLRQDKLMLEEDMILKSKELANFTMQLVNKKQAFNEIQDDLKELKKLVKSSRPKEKVTEMFKKLHQHKIGENYMEIYDVNFEKIHHNFFEKLTKRNPNLTERELRLCAFVKMKLTNKEISPLLNISVRGVETARYRIRKKLGIDHESNFHEFLVNL